MASRPRTASEPLVPLTAAGSRLSGRTGHVVSVRDLSCQSTVILTQFCTHTVATLTDRVRSQAVVAFLELEIWAYALFFFKTASYHYFSFNTMFLKNRQMMISLTDPFA